MLGLLGFFIFSSVKGDREFFVGMLVGEFLLVLIALTVFRLEGFRLIRRPSAKPSE
jgi:hypothetical protein